MARRKRPFYSNEVPRGTHVVYEARGKNGEFLYIGVTSHFAQRMRQHRRESPWWCYAQLIELNGPFLTRSAADEYETRSIRRFRPPYNTAGWR